MSSRAGHTSGRLRLRQMWGWCCAYCDTPFTPTGRSMFTVDHYRPRSAGGSSRLENLVAACERCNTARGGVDALEFLVERGHGDVVRFIETRNRWCAFVHQWRRRAVEHLRAA